MHEIERLKTRIDEESISSEILGSEATNFIRHYASQIVYLLDELRSKRDTESGGLNHTSTHRTILEGFSDKSPSAALSEALQKAAFYFSEQHDISITLQKLMALPQGGHRAIIEVHVTPMTFRHHLHLQAPDVELKRIHDHDYSLEKKVSEEHIKHLIFDHFATTSGGRQAEIPDYFLININDALLLNQLIEKEFFKAGHYVKTEDPVPDSKPIQILVRAQKPFPHPHP